MNKSHDYRALEREYVTTDISFRELCRRNGVRSHRRAEISDKFLDAIDEAITKFRADLKATKTVRQADGSITEEPVMRLTPKDVAILIDRFQVLFERPSVISHHQGDGVTAEISADTLRQFIELTRDAAAPTTKVVSPLPRPPRRLDD